MHGSNIETIKIAMTQIRRTRQPGMTLLKLLISCTQIVRDSSIRIDNQNTSTNKKKALKDRSKLIQNVWKDTLQQPLVEQYSQLTLTTAFGRTVFSININ